LIFPKAVDPLETPRLIAQAHYTGVELQIMKIELAHTMLNQLTGIHDEAIIERTHFKVLKIYNAVVASLAKLHSTYGQQVRIDQRLGELEARLGNRYG
jgi:hypothetical protein